MKRTSFSSSRLQAPCTGCDDGIGTRFCGPMTVSGASMTVSAAQSDDAPRRWPASSSQRLLKRSPKGSDRPKAAVQTAIPNTCQRSLGVGRSLQLCEAPQVGRGRAGGVGVAKTLGPPKVRGLCIDSSHSPASWPSSTRTLIGALPEPRTGPGTKPWQASWQVSWLCL